jgi:hypothetical protein
MIKRNEFFEIVSGMFALLMFSILGSIIIKTTSNNIFSLISTFLFIIGAIFIALALIQKLYKLFR